MKTAAIVTLFHNNYNYGGMLQAYALYNILEDLGVKVTEIDYNSAHNRNIFGIIKRNIPKIVINPVGFYKERKNVHENSNRAKKYLDWSEKVYGKDIYEYIFQKFIDNNFRKTEEVNSKTITQLNKEFDFAIAGGDQVFNPMFADDTFFLKTIKANRKVAYSASIAKDNLSAKEKKLLRNGLVSFNEISVREKQGQELLAELGIDSVVIIDPVGLFTLQKWKTFSRPVCIHKPYIFAYFLGELSMENIVAKKYADMYQMPIALIPHIWRRYNNDDEKYSDILLPGTTPEEFVWLIANAEYILTDSFHGTLFSILFNKQFYCFNRFERMHYSFNSRLLSLLKMFGLESRMVKLEDFISGYNDTIINYSAINAAIDEKRNQGLQFLRKLV